MGAAPAGALLRVEGLTKTYPPNVRALRNVTLDIESGKVTALLGANGAGKSTLARIITGVEKPTSGTLIFDGRKIAMSGPSDGHALGIAAIYQELPLLPNLSAAENMSLGHTERPLLGIYRAGPSRTLYEALAAGIPDAPGPDVLVGRLGVGQRQKVAFVRALSMRPRLLVVDEGTSSLSLGERQEMQHLLQDLAHAQGIAVVYITHFIDDALTCSDRILAMRDGELALDRPTAATAHRDVLEILGGKIDAGTTADVTTRAKPRTDRGLDVRDLRCAGAGPVSFTVGIGECVGLYGPPGCGATDLLRAVAGLNAHAGGLRWAGAELPASVFARVRRNVVFCDGDRAKNLILSWTVSRNIGLPTLFRQPMLSIPSRKAANARAEQVIAHSRIVGTAGEPIRNLSGGNQQRVAVGRALALGRPLLLIGDDPTRGVDIVARKHIHGLLREALGDGAAILIYSSDPEEVVALCDRVIVVRDGTFVRELCGEAITVPTLEGTVQDRARTPASPKTRDDR